MNGPTLTPRTIPQAECESRTDVEAFVAEEEDADENHVNPGSEVMIYCFGESSGELITAAMTDGGSLSSVSGVAEPDAIMQVFNG
jgi:hypothetical protein